MYKEERHAPTKGEKDAQNKMICPNTARFRNTPKRPHTPGENHGHTPSKASSSGSPQAHEVTSRKDSDVESTRQGSKSSYDIAILCNVDEKFRQDNAADERFEIVTIKDLKINNQLLHKLNLTDRLRKTYEHKYKKKN